MTTRKRNILIGCVAIFGIIIIAAAIFVATLDVNRAKKYISAGVSKATGRELIIGGDLELDFGWISRIRASQIQFQNAPWGKNPQMAEVGLLDLEVDLWQLLKRRFVLPTLTISQLKIFLEKNPEGAPNWEFRAAPVVEEPIVPDSGPSFPSSKN